MSFTPTTQLKADPTTWLRNSQTASRLFVDDQFRLSPKQKFLFHVSFGINQAALKTPELLHRHRNEINMLVKSIDLPKYTITTETLNQYNRKKVVQVQHKYENIGIKFHDDNIGIINQLWQNYYSYYYADTTTASNNNAYSRNATRSSDFINGKYGFDNGSTSPFFTYIKIYQMARHEYVCYTLINPVIISMGHNQLSYSSNEFNEVDMSIAYEAVTYDTGLVSSDTVEGFAMEHYDLTPSPLSVQPSTYDSGILSTTSPSFATSLNMNTQAADIVNTITQQINTYQNTQVLTNQGTTGILGSAIRTATAGVGGLQGIEFPVSTTNTTATTAAPIILR